LVSTACATAVVGVEVLGVTVETLALQQLVDDDQLAQLVELLGGQRGRDPAHRTVAVLAAGS
jgi:hypothetical protein